MIVLEALEDKEPEHPQHCECPACGPDSKAAHHIEPYDADAARY